MISASGLCLYLTFCSLTAAVNWGKFKENHVDLDLSFPRIIGGEEAVPHSFPYQVGLLINGNAFCGGSLISENYVLTAAHCGAVISYVEVILGAQNITADESTQVHILGEEVIVHEDFNYTDFQNDISLIRLSEPAPLNDYIKTISLPSRNDANITYLDETVTSTGWGLSADVDHVATINDLSENLRYVNVSVLSLPECGAYYNDYDNNILYITEKTICTSGYRNKGTCNGDSGGPLIYFNEDVENAEPVQIGLVSTGTNLCEVCSPSIFTNVAKFLDWIEDNSDVVIS